MVWIGDTLLLLYGDTLSLEIIERGQSDSSVFHSALSVEFSGVSKKNKKLYDLLNAMKLFIQNDEHFKSQWLAYFLFNIVFFLFNVLLFYYLCLSFLKLPNFFFYTVSAL